MQTPAEAFEKPLLCIGSGLQGVEARKARVEAAVEARLLVELELRDHAPGELIAAQNAGQSLQRQGRGENGGRSEGLLRIEAERRDWRRAQFHAGAGFVLIGRDKAIENAKREQCRFNDGDEAAAAP